MLIDVRNNDKSLDLRERVRAVWYVMLAALEDVETQRKGVCMLASLKTARITQVLVSYCTHVSLTLLLRSISSAGWPFDVIVNLDASTVIGPWFETHPERGYFLEHDACLQVLPFRSKKTCRAEIA